MSVEAVPRYTVGVLDDGEREMVQLQVSLPGGAATVAVHWRRMPPRMLPPAGSRHSPVQLATMQPALLFDFPPRAGVADSSEILFTIESERQLRVHVPGRYLAVSGGRPPGKELQCG